MSLLKPISRGAQVGAVCWKQILLHALGICRISKTNMLNKSEIREDKITTSRHEKMHRCDWQRARQANVIGSRVKNAVSFWLECNSAGVGAFDFWTLRLQRYTSCCWYRDFSACSDMRLIHSATAWLAGAAWRHPRNILLRCMLSDSQKCVYKQFLLYVILVFLRK